MSTAPAAKRFCELLAYEPETGVLRWRQHRYPKRVGQEAGTSRPDGRVVVWLEGKLYLRSRIAWLLTHGEWPVAVDHRNGDPSDDRLSNIREYISQTENQQNRHGASPYSKTGLIGVEAHCSGAFKAVIYAGGKRHYLGLYPSPEAAHAAYRTAKRGLHAFNPEVRAA